MKGNKGITLIALIVTIIVLIILAGVAIAMLSGDSGILNRASEARYETVIASFDEQVKLAAVNVKATITSKMVSSQGYIATKTESFSDLIKEVQKDLGLSQTGASSASANTEGFAVYRALTASDGSNEGVGYITIAYSDNALRASLPLTKATENSSQPNFNGVTYTTIKNSTDTTYSVNKAVLVYVIKVTNYGCSLSKPVLTDTDTVATVSGYTTQSAFEASANPILAALGTF